MVKKINFILVLLLLLVSIGAVSATDDLNDTIASDNNAIQDESMADEVLASDIDEVVASGSHTIDKTNYYNYFDSNGELKDSSISDGDTINLDGDFSDINFVFNRPINIVGTSTNNLRGCTVTLNSGASGSSISTLNIFNSAQYEYGIFLNGATNCLVQGCFVNNTGASAYAICLGNGANYNNVTNNDFHAYGITYGHGTRSTSPMLISGSDYNNITNNNITCWDANGIYLSSFSGGPLLGGASNFNLIYNNTIKYCVLPTSWSYGIQVMGSNNTIGSNKVIGAYRGISTSGSGNMIIGNQIINITGADYNDPDNEIGGEAGIVGSYKSLIKDNIIVHARIIQSGAGITSLDYSTVENNYVDVLYKGSGINPQGSNINILRNNISTVSGAGILSNTYSFNITIDSNNITSQSGVGILIQKISSKRMPGNITIVDNFVKAGNSKVYAIDAKDVDKSTENLIEDNFVPKGYGDVATPDGVFDASKPIFKYKGNTIIVNQSNFNESFYENGALSSNVNDGDILIFKGEFSNKVIILNKPVKVVGNDATFFNTTFKVFCDGVWVENLTIKNNKSGRLNAWGVLVYRVFGAKVINCNIEVYDPNAAYAIYVVESTDVDVINNTLFSSGNYLTYTLLAFMVDDCKFINNTIKTLGTGDAYINTGMDACIDGDESCVDGNENCLDGNENCLDGNENCLDGNENCLDGNENCLDGNENCLDGNTFNGNHVVPAEVYRTYGILMLYSSGNIVSGNKINATSKLNRTLNTTESTNSVIGIDLYYNSHNNLFSNNEIYIKANDNYLYGMGVLGYKSTDIAPEGQGASNNQFINNNIILDGTYFVEGFVIGSSSEDTTLISNTVVAKSDCVNYGINLEMSQKSIIDKNSFTLNSDIVYGIESFDSSKNDIHNNEFNINAKQGYGFLLSNSKNNRIYENIIFVNTTGEEVNFKNYDVISAGNDGIYLKANSTNNNITDNNITSQKGYSIIIDNEAINNYIFNNYLVSELGKGDDGVNNTENNIVKNNYYQLVTGELLEVTINYLENGTMIFRTEDSGLNGAIVKFIDMDDNIIGSSVVSNCEAKLEYNFADYTPTSYIYYAEVSKKDFKLTRFNSTINVDDGDLNLSVDNATGPVARNTNFVAHVNNILNQGVSGISVEFYVVDDGYKIYIGKSTTDKNGVANLVGEIPQIYSDNPEIIAEINNPYHFKSTSAKSNLTAYWLTKTKIELVSNVYPDGNVAILKDEKGMALANKEVIVKIGSNTYQRTTNSAGAITMPIIAKGSYDVSFSFAGDEQYYSSKNSGKITVLQSIFENTDTTVYYGNTIQYKVRVKGSDGSFGAGNLVTIKVNGQTYKVLTDANGYATQSIKLKAGSYTITAEYKGDFVSNKITFKPTLTAKNIVKKKAKKIKFSVKVVNKNGKAVKKKKVTFKIKGKKYTAKTNKKGVATVTIKNLKVGKYTITSSYGGCTIKNTIKIKK